MFVAKALKEGSTLYHSRLTDTRYIVASVAPKGLTPYHLALYVNGRLSSPDCTRRDAMDAIEYHEMILLSVKRGSVSQRA